MKQKNNFIFLLAAGFFAALLGITATFAAFGVYPFGSGSVLVTDMTQQYIDYFACFKNLLDGTANGGITYTWSGGLGMNFIGIYAYYLSSPFSFLVLLFPKSMITEAVLCMIILKIALASPAFLLFAKSCTKNLKPHYLWLSCAYALMGFCMAYFFNLMWLDAVILLPVICLGVNRLIERSRSDVLAISLFLLFFANFYISFMAGIAVFFYFIMRLFFNNENYQKKYIIISCVKFFVSVLLAAGCAAVLLLPAYKQLSSCYITSDGFSLTGKIAATPIELIQKMLPGVYDSVTTYGTPYIYCGTVTLALLPLYFLNKSISKKQKICAAAILFLFALSFVFYDISVIWHVFRPPTWFNARHSFTFCFFAVTFALFAAEHPEGLTKKRLFWGYCLNLMLIVLAAIGEWAGAVTLIFSFISVTVFYCGFFAVVCGIFKKPEIKINKLRLKTAYIKATAAVLVLLLVVGEAAYNGVCTFNGLETELGFDTRREYTEFTKQAGEAVETAKQYESLNDNSALYRMENQGMRWSNDNMSLSYNGIAHYSSLSNQYTYRTLYELGVLCVTGYRYLRYYGTTGVTDSLLGIKYVLSDTYMNKQYNNVASCGKYNIYQNPNALQIGFFAQSSALNYNYLQADPVEGQNELMQAVTGSNEVCFTPLELTANYNGLDINEQDGGLYITASSLNPYIEYTMTAAHSGEQYLWVDSTLNERSPIFVNGERLGDDNDDFLRGIIPIGIFNEGDTITVKIFMTGRTSAFIMGASAYSCNTEVVNSLFAQLKEGCMQNVTLNDSGTVLTGTISTTQNGLLLTTVPYDEGWEVYVNGEKCEYTCCAEAFIAVPLETAGNYSIEMRFTPCGLKTGAIVTAVSIILLCAFLISEARIKRRNKNEQ